MRRGEEGQVTLLIIGFASLCVMAIAMLLDASAAFLQRQDLDNLADGAALHGADLGSSGVYDEGIPADRLLQQEQAVRSSVRSYLRDTGAEGRFPGIEVVVGIDQATRSVTVTLQAPLDLPLTVPGAPKRPIIGASSTAAVTVVD